MRIYITIRELNELKGRCNKRCDSCKGEIVCSFIGKSPKDWTESDNAIQEALKNGIEIIGNDNENSNNN